MSKINVFLAIRASALEGMNKCDGKIIEVNRKKYDNGHERRRVIPHQNNYNRRFINNKTRYNRRSMTRR